MRNSPHVVLKKSLKKAHLAANLIVAKCKGDPDQAVEKSSLKKWICFVCYSGTVWWNEDLVGTGIGTLQIFR